MRTDSDNSSLNFLDNALFKNEWSNEKSGKDLTLIKKMDNNQNFDNNIKGKNIFYLIIFNRRYRKYAISLSKIQS